MATSYRPKSFGFARIHRGRAPKLSDLSISQTNVRKNTIFLRNFGIYIYIPNYIYRERERVCIISCICILSFIYIYIIYTIFSGYIYICIYMYICIYIWYIIFNIYQTTRNKSGSQRPIGGSSVLVGIQPMASLGKNGFRQRETADFLAPSCRKMVI